MSVSPPGPTVKSTEIDKALTEEFFAAVQADDVAALTELWQKHSDKIDINAFVEDPREREAPMMTPLSTAQWRGNTNALKFLLSLKDANGKLLVDLNKPSSEVEKQTAYEISLMSEQEEISKLLKDAGAKLEMTDDNTQKWFKDAVKKNNKVLLNFVMQHPDPKKLKEIINKNYNFTERGEMPALCFACQEKNKKLLEFLLANGADPNVQDKEGRPALAFAFQKGNTDVLNILINHPGIKLDLVDNQGNNALMWAIEAGNLDATKLLLSKNFNLNVKNNNNETVLMQAIKANDKKLLDFLFSQNQISAMIDLEDKDNNTPLTLLCAKPTNPLDLEVITKLLAKGANPFKKNNKGMSAFALAVKFNNLEAVKLILEHPDAQQNIDLPYNAQTALMMAVNKNNFALTEVLIKKGADVNKVAEKGEVIMDTIKENGWAEIVVNKKNVKRDYTPEMAMFVEQADAIRKYGHVLGLGVSVDSNSSDTRTLTIKHPESQKNVMIETDGWDSLPAARTLTEYLTNHIEKLRNNPEEQDDFRRIQKAHKNNRNYLEYDRTMTDKVLHGLYQHQEPIVLSSGWRQEGGSHDFAVVLDGDYLIVCNRGGRAFERGEVNSLTEAQLQKMRGETVIIYKIPDRTKITEEYISKIRDVTKEPDKEKKPTEIMSHIYSVLEKDKNAKPIPFCILDTKEQRHGTCAYANIKSSTQGLCFVQKYRRLQEQNKTAGGIKLTDDQMISAAKAYAKKNYKNFTKDMRDQAVAELIKVLNPATQVQAIPPKIDKELAFQLLLLDVLAHHGQKKAAKYDRAEKMETEVFRVQNILKHLLPADAKRLLSELDKRKVNLLAPDQNELLGKLANLIDTIKKGAGPVPEVPSITPLVSTISAPTTPTTLKAPPKPVVPKSPEHEDKPTKPILHYFAGAAAGKEKTEEEEKRKAEYTPKPEDTNKLQK